MNHGWSPNRNDPEWEQRVEREAERTTNATQHAYEKAQARLARAETALAKAEAAPSKRQSVAKLAAVVEVRRQELLDLHRMMTQTSRPSTQRGRGSYRGVPSGEVL